MREERSPLRQHAITDLSALMPLPPNSWRSSSAPLNVPQAQIGAPRRDRGSAVVQVARRTAKAAGRQRQNETGHHAAIFVWKIDVRNGPLASTYRMKENTGDEVHHLDLRLAAGL